MEEMKEKEVTRTRIGRRRTQTDRQTSRERKEDKWRVERK